MTDSEHGRNIARIAAVDQLQARLSDAEATFRDFQRYHDVFTVEIAAWVNGFRRVLEGLRDAVLELRQRG